MPPPCLYLKHLQAIDPSFVTITKPLSNKRGETFCEGLKLMWKLFEIMDKRFCKTFHFLKFSKHFIIKLAQENP